MPFIVLIPYRIAVPSPEGVYECQYEPQKLTVPSLTYPQPQMPPLHSLFPRQAERPSFSPDTLAGYNLSDKSTQKPTIWQVNLVLIVLVGAVVSLRIVCRAYITRRLFVDDYLIILAGLFTLVSASMALAATRYGLGEHIWNLPLPVDNMLEMLTQCVKVSSPSRYSNSQLRM